MLTNMHSEALKQHHERETLLMKAMMYHNVNNEEGLKAPGILVVWEQFLKFKADLDLKDGDLLNINYQMFKCNLFEVEKIKEFCEEEAFWKHF